MFRQIGNYRSNTVNTDIDGFRYNDIDSVSIFDNKKDKENDIYPLW